MHSNQAKFVTLEEFNKIKREDDVKLELIDHHVFAHARPNLKHQKIQQALSAELYFYLKENPCNVISEAELLIDENVVIPDIFIYCDSDDKDIQSYSGIPLVVIEILSDSTRFIDYNKKMRLYESRGIHEYWIINPKLHSISVYNFKDATSSEFVVGDEFKSIAMDGLMLDLGSIF